MQCGSMSRQPPIRIISGWHIPFPEYGEAYEAYLNADDSAKFGQGEYLEHVLHGYENNGAYEALRAAGIVGFFAGHDHINYGDFLYHADSADASDRAIFSYGVKTTNQLYHDQNMMGYKVVTLRDLTVAEYLSAENIHTNYKNVTGGYASYENH